MQALDAWVQQGLVRVRQQQGRGEEEAGSGTTCFFIDLPNAPHALAGALRPSRDRVGRTYPFLVAVEIEKREVDGRRIPSWPVRYAQFYEAAVTVVDEAVDGHLADADLAPRLATLRRLYDSAAFPVDYGHRFRQATASSLWARTWGDPEDGRKYVLLKNLTERLARANGRAPREALQIALPDDAAPLDVSFWAEAYWHLLGRPPAQPALFWSLAGPGEAPPVLFLASAPPPADLLVHLYSPGVVGYNGVIALDDALGQPAALAALALPAEIGTLLEDDALDLHTFLQRL